MYESRGWSRAGSSSPAVGTRAETQSWINNDSVHSVQEFEMSFWDGFNKMNCKVTLSHYVHDNFPLNFPELKVFKVVDKQYFILWFCGVSSQWFAWVLIGTYRNTLCRMKLYDYFYFKMNVLQSLTKVFSCNWNQLQLEMVCMKGTGL